MSPMLMNLGLAPIPPTPVIPADAKPPPAKFKSTVSRLEASKINQKIMVARNLERAEYDRRSALDYIKAEKFVTVKAMAWRFDWSDAKAGDIMQVLKKRGKVQMVGKGKAAVWGPVCQS